MNNQNSFFLKLEKGLTVFNMMVYQGVLLELVLSGGSQENELVESVSTPMRITFFLTYLITLSLLSLRWKQIIPLLSRNWSIWVLILLPVISLCWSFEPDITLKNSFTLVCSSLFGIYLTSRYSLKEQLQLLSWSFYIIIVLSFVFAIGLPKYGLMGDFHQGKWRGVFSHKNGLGATMVMSSIVFLIRAYSDRQKNLVVWGGFSLSFLLLLLSSSTSALINCSILIAAFFVLQILRLPYMTMIPALTAIITIGTSLNFWLVNNSAVLFNAVGKDATLTGRTELWQLVWDMIWKQPWIGYGYGGFWNDYNGESAYVWRAITFHPSHAHSGYLNLLLDFGFLGLAIFWLGFMMSFFKALFCMRLSRTAEDIWPMIFLIYLLIANQSESALIASNSMEWILYVATSFSLGSKLQSSEKVMASMGS
jgi:exopolysaccharide production protein ExoQ